MNTEHIQTTVFPPKLFLSGIPQPEHNKPTEYVCGFLFNTVGDYVVLIKRRESRSYRPGCWNGVGGHVEPGETPLQAMRREFKEEAGLDIKDWKHFLSLTTDMGEAVIHFFYTEQPTEVMYKVSTETDETVRPISLKALASLPRMPNLSWLIPMALSMRNDRASSFVMSEVYERGCNGI